LSSCKFDAGLKDMKYYKWHNLVKSEGPMKEEEENLTQRLLVYITKYIQFQ